MGCLNDNDFRHWFGNIHLSGPCNRSCYFCIGQHMMALDPYDVLEQWPLPHIAQFILECVSRDIREVYLTGSNTEPLLYKHIPLLVALLRRRIYNSHIGIRTNGILVPQMPFEWGLFDEASITVCSTDKATNNVMMGGDPPDLREIADISKGTGKQITLNITLGPENKDNVLQILDDVVDIFPWKWINLREPYGQPHVGNPLDWTPSGVVHGMPFYLLDNGVKITYWDVHFVEVKSVNLYANGVISTDYAVSKGHDPSSGEVKDQRWFAHGRQVQQWQYSKYQQRGSLHKIKSNPFWEWYTK